MKSYAKFYVGKNIYDAEVPDLDINMSDAELFEVALHQMAVQWSSTAGHPHHKDAMRKDGKVARSKERVYIRGNGWSVSLHSPEFVEKHSAYLAAAEWKLLTDLLVFDTCWNAN
ncbi:hypothetical protein RVBP17_3700 [Pseudomonas phage sp. 30-3]|nr:hypothetical protein GBBBJNDB_00329 [Pseudomonas phage Callisto]WPK40049.1 hypothetical protein ETTORE_0340 [Pseudomonas phage Ettore]BDR26327.1 hypothetical protein RVBP17_3700 [Pseudomonas phage sp. 30-3]